MASESASCAALRVGEWLVVPDLNQIGRGSEIVRLEPKAMAVLLHLARGRGAVATRDELLAAAWPQVVVGDNALTQVIIKLRRALGDSAREPRYIEAIAKKGYRLIAAVVQATADSSLHEPDRPIVGVASVALRPRPDPMPTRAAPARSSWWIAAGIAIMVLAAAVVLAVQGRESDPARGIEARSESSPGAALPTVRVEPFEAAGADSRQTLIARGITADLVTDLSKVSGIWVTAGPERASAEGAGTARARYVLSGTVLGDGKRLRVYAHLSDVVAGRELWSQRFDREAKDLFAVQDDLARTILAVLPVKVTETETLRLARRYTRNLEAYEYFLVGQRALLVRSGAQNEVAREMYWKAVNADPTFARAYAGLALTYALDYQLGWSDDADAALKRALEFARTAEQMNPDLAETQWVLGFVDAQQRQHDKTLRRLDTALRLNPSYADAYALKGGIYTYIGRPGDAVPLLRTALRLNPQAGSLYFLLLGRAYYFLGDRDQARINLEQALLRNSENLEARIYLAAVDHADGRRDAEQWEVSEIRSLEPRFDLHRWLASYPLSDPEQRELLAKSLQEVGL